MPRLKKNTMKSIRKGDAIEQIAAVRKCRGLTARLGGAAAAPLERTTATPNRAEGMAIGVT